MRFSGCDRLDDDESGVEGDDDDGGDFGANGGDFGANGGVHGDDADDGYGNGGGHGKDLAPKALWSFQTLSLTNTQI